MEHVYLTRRNLLTLLNKLNRKREGGESLCSIIKTDTVHPKYPCTHTVMITALEDEEYYIDRQAGNVLDAPKQV